MEPKNNVDKIIICYDDEALS